MQRPAWYASRYEQLAKVAILATTTAKKLLSPMPGAIAKGLFARKAMHIVPTPEVMQVAMNTPFQMSTPWAPNPVSRLGFKAMI